MTTSPITTFAKSLSSFLEDRPEINDDEAKAAKAAFSALSKRSFTTDEDAIIELSETVSRFQESSNKELAAAVRHLFDQTIHRHQSSHRQESTVEQKRTREEAPEVETRIRDLPQDALANVVGFLDEKSRGRAAQVSRSFYSAVHQSRINDLIALRDNPKTKALLHLVGFDFDFLNQPPSEINAAYERLSKKLKEIGSLVYRKTELHEGGSLLRDEDRAQLLLGLSHEEEIVRNPDSVLKILQAFYDLSLVRSVYLDYSAYKTLEERVGAARTYIESKGDDKQLPEGRIRFIFPSELCSLTTLTELSLSLSDLSDLPQEFGQLKGLRRLSLAGNNLRTFPEGLLELTELEELDLAGNSITSLPEGIGRMSGLRILDLSENPINSLPPQISQLRLNYFIMGHKELPPTSHRGINWEREKRSAHSFYVME
jgi:hypothetical protein